MMKKKVYIIVTEHFDIMWRRPFDRDFQFKGQNFVSYADLEGYYILDNLALCEKYPEYKFTIESVAVLRKFLEHHPEYEEKLRELYKEGRVFTTFSGDNIVDSNMVQGESIVRNYLYGLEYLKDNFDFVPYGVDRNDAFGNSGQLPQIARGFDSKWIYHITYTEPDNPYWRGIDGSTVYCYTPKAVGSTGGYYKYAPCPVCKGHKDTHCDVCGDRRIDVPRMEKVRRKLSEVNEEYINTSKIPGYIYVGGEEILPTDDIVKWARENKDKYDIEYATFDTYVPDIRDALERVDDADESALHSMQEINVNNTGTYVTRIRTKQKVRENENLISKAETLAAIHGLNGGSYESAYIKKMWEKLHFTMFHDAITATHVDAAYEELMEVHDSLTTGLNVKIDELQNKLAEKTENKVTVLNTLGVKADCVATAVLPGDESTVLRDAEGNSATILNYQSLGDMVKLTFKTGEMKPFETREFVITKEDKRKTKKASFELDMSVNGDAVLTDVVADKSVTVDDKKYAIENEYYKVTANINGILTVFDKTLSRDIAKKGQYYVGEYILEHDEGSPWSTLSEDMRRQPLSGNTKLVEYESNDDYQRFTFRVRVGAIDGYSVTGLLIDYSVSLYKGVKQVDFSSKIFWDTQNYRLRVAFPCTIDGKHLYEIPYGYIERKPYKPEIVWSSGASRWASAAGDWPAINWAGIQSENGSVALLNKGTPSYQINIDETGVENIYLSVLRSPSVGTYLHDPAAYSMTDYDGMRDAGEHEFSYALVSYAEGFDQNTVVADGYAYNNEAALLNGSVKTLVMPEFTSKDARIAAMKHSQKGDMMILRIVEYHGVDSEFELSLPEGLKMKEAWEMNLNEKPIRQMEVKNNKIKMKISKFKIVTIGVSL